MDYFILIYYYYATNTKQLTKPITNTLPLPNIVVFIVLICFVKSLLFLLPFAIHLIMLLDVLHTARSITLITTSSTTSHTQTQTYTHKHSRKFHFCVSLSFVSAEGWSSVEERDDKCVREK